MKKLMFAAFACAALNALCVESQIVGYNSIKMATVGGFNVLTPDFTDIAGSGTNKLADIKVNENFSLGETLQFFDEGGAAKKFTLPDGTEDVEGLFNYYDGEELYELMNPKEDDQHVYGYSYPSEIHPPSGWYILNNDGEYDVLYCMNDVEIPYGNSVVVYNNNADTGIVSAGAVSEEDAKVSLFAGGFNLVGNCMPHNWTLGDIAINENFTLGETLQFFDEGGAAQKFTLPDGTEDVEGLFNYYDGEELYELMNPKEDDQHVYGYSYPSEIHPPSGWYILNNDGEYDVLYCMNSIPVNAGDGFAIYCNTDDAGIVIPSPLADK